MARSPADDIRFVHRFAAWTQTLPADIDASWALVTHDGIGAAGRRVLVGGLSYLLTQFDLIPDHERVGTVDDAMVLRLAHVAANEHAQKAGADEAKTIAGFVADDALIREYLGDVLYGKLKSYVLALADKNIRTRTADQVLASEELRRDMRRELDEAEKQLPPPLEVPDAKATDVAVNILGYLKVRLG